ncbi:hypothetical protein BDBG_05920 [Blastomyces gilchristii SLH14081]|uniref:Uncharacterized protein n=1 Tax=Blastomyces gilchristii (strain SLH14081) TaxID=559298 RepID=A0A179UQ95_BLAGS|nr:uncharacterized protein BDBG_05920 [Blastomyces gilchristii SLH14081]OAT10255.1 hypothetical protein BDBG_05920 [Blastomyces gilchristii SLH14081]
MEERLWGLDTEERNLALGWQGMLPSTSCEIGALMNTPGHSSSETEMLILVLDVSKTVRQFGMRESRRKVIRGQEIFGHTGCP